MQMASEVVSLPADHVDDVLADWERERPGIDRSPVAVIARVGRACAYLDRGLNDTLQQFGLNRSTFDLLATLRRTGAPYRLSPTTLFRSLMRTSGAMTHLVDRVEAMGLVERVPDPDDRRGVLVGLTPDGGAFFDRVGKAHLENERSLLAALTAEEQAALAGLLKKLLLSFEAEGRDGPSRLPG